MGEGFWCIEVGRDSGQGKRFLRLVVPVAVQILLIKLVLRWIARNDY